MATKLTPEQLQQLGITPAQAEELDKQLPGGLASLVQAGVGGPTNPPGTVPGGGGEFGYGPGGGQGTPLGGVQHLLGALGLGGIGGGGGGSSKSNPKAAPAQATPAKSGPPAPIWDPLALQSMWATVFGPIFNQVAKIQGGSGSDYLNAMNGLIAGSNQPAAAQAQDRGQADAMAQILQSVNKGAAGSVAAQPTFDSLIQALQAASSSAQLYQGEAQKAIAYGTNANAAQAFTNPAGTSSAGLSPTQTAALLQSALAGSQTANPLQVQRPPAAVVGGSGLIP